MSTRLACLWAGLAVWLLAAGASGARLRSPADGIHAGVLDKGKGKGGKPDVKKEKHPYSSPSGLFIQERASKQLPGPGQHFSFGALVDWAEIHQLLQDTPESKLVFLIRHGQAVSNFLSDSLGPDIWFNLESRCSYTDDNGTYWGIFDADLTDLGEAEATALNSMLKDGGWYDKLTNSLPAPAIISPLSRCLETTLLAMKGIPITAFHVDEDARETLGEDTCDARRAASDPQDGDPGHLIGPCQFTIGLRNKFPEFEFPVSRRSVKMDGSTSRDTWGLLADEDPLWTTERETQSHQTKRALHFLDDLFALVEERVVFVVTHSGFTRSVLLAVGREPYRPQNTELVPVIIVKHQPYSSSGSGSDAAAEGLQEVQAADVA